jgi:hypothetical protein
MVGSHKCDNSECVQREKAQPSDGPRFGQYFEPQLVCVRGTLWGRYCEVWVVLAGVGVVGVTKASGTHAVDGVGGIGFARDVPDQKPMTYRIVYGCPSPR